MRIVEMIIDELQELAGIQAISVVEEPAIEEDFVALNSQDRVELATQSEEKRILLGAALIPDKMIYRRNGEDEYYIYFSKDTIRQAQELYMKSFNQGNATLEHAVNVEGLTVVETWIKEGDQDKSNLYGMDLPVGTWFVSMKIDNDEIWNDFVKTGKVKGFSIEGYFVDKAKKQLSKQSDEESDELYELLREVVAKEQGIELESYSDYPEAVKNNAKRGIELNEKNNNKCATQVGKVRAQQLAKGEAVSMDTIKRMYSYLSRAEEYYEEGDTDSCGYISYLLWGGKAALRWSKSKLDEE